MSEGPLFERLLAAARDRQLAGPTLAAYRRTWMKLIAWTTAEGFDLAALRREKARAYYEALTANARRRITSRSKRPSPSSTRSWIAPARSWIASYPASGDIECSGLSGIKFAALHGVKYPSFANWVQQRKRHRLMSAASAGPESGGEHVAQMHGIASNSC